MKRPLGCLTRLGIGVALLTLLAIGGVLLAWGGRLFSPGPLNVRAGDAVLGRVRSHAETGGRCAACHPAPWSRDTMADRCLACHTGIADERADPTTLHGALAAAGTSPDCRGCHTEHGGPEAALTHLDPASFPHAATGYALDGHKQTAEGRPFACADCHGPDVTRFDPATCADCHQRLDAAYVQAHTAAFGTGCLACHDGLDTYGRQFDHNRLAFALQGRHAAVDCAGCHPGARSIAGLQAAPQACYACHEKDDEHGGQFGRDCAACHTADGWDQATVDHDKTAFPLTGKHVGVACQDCHKNNVFKGTPQACYACHEKDDEHGGQFGQDCAACHTADGWDQATVDHDKTAFPLTGKHVGVACQDCHKNNVFKGTPQACYACHQTDDAHAGQFGQDCAACHTADGWDQATVDHDKTAFPLTGKHVDVACRDCHRDNVFKGTPVACSACHDDPAYHRGLFGTGCQDCHTAAGWSPARFNRPHRFPIGHGEGGASTCRTCHPDSLQAYTCYGCHEHQEARIAAKHREEGIADFRDCVRCHPTGREGQGGD